MTALLVLIYVAFISLGLPDTILGSAWPAMGPDLGAALSQAGIISGTAAVCTVISSAVSARVIARLGTGRVTAISVIMTAAALLGFGVAGKFWMLCLLAVPLGLGAGSVDAALNNFVALHYSARHMSWLHCFWGVGATGGPLVMSWWLSRSGGWRGGYLSIGAFQLLLAIFMFATLKMWNRAKPDADGGGEEARVLSFREMLALPCSKAAYLTFFCYCGLEQTAGLWGASYMTGHLGIPAETAAAWISFFFLGITGGRFVNGLLTKRFSDGALIRMGQGLILLGIITLVIPKPDYLLPAAFFLIGFGCAPVFPSMLHRTPQTFGKDNSQSMMGSQMACSYVGTTLMAPIFGVIAQLLDVKLLPLYLLALLAVMLFATEYINKFLRGEKK